MTNHRGPIANLISHLSVRCRHDRCEGTLAKLQATGLDLGGAGSIAELAGSCQETSNRERAERVVSGLVLLARDDELAAVGALVALAPALVRLSRRLIVAGVEGDRAEIDVIDVAYEQVMAVSERMRAGHAMRHVARTVVGTSWDRLRWALRAEQRCALRSSQLEAAGELVAPEERDDAASSARLMLTEAAAHGIISAEAARVICATRIEGRSFRSLACELHKGEAALRKCRQRSERALAERQRSKGLTGQPGACPGHRAQEVR